MNTAANAALAAAKPAKAKKSKNDLEIAIHAAAGNGKKATGLDVVDMGEAALKGFLKSCKDAKGKDERKLLAEAMGFDESTIKVLGKMGPKEAKQFAKGIKTKLKRAKLEALFAQLGEHGLEVKYVKGKSKSLDKVMGDLYGEKDGVIGGWSIWQILGAALAAGVVGVAIYEGYQWATGGQGLFGNYSPNAGGVDSSGFATYENVPQHQNVVHMR